MYCSRVLLFFYFALIYAVFSTAAQYCYDTGNYTRNSTYRANLKTLLTSMSSNAKIDYGFYNFSVGKSPDKVSAIVLCRPDISSSECRSCINESSYKLLQSSPYQKEAIISPEKCSLRYSFKSIFGIMDSTPMLFFYNTRNFSDVEEFYKVLFPFLDNLRNRTSSGNSTHKFAFQSVTLPNFQKIYALLKCTPDLSWADCKYCLSQVQNFIPKCCYGKQGGQFVTPSCDLRFEVYPFFNLSTELPPILPPTTQGTWHWCFMSYKLSYFLVYLFIDIFC